MTTSMIVALLMAFAQVESSNRNLAPYWDKGGLAFGFYGFHEARWVELGGDPAKFGHATRLEQDAVMVAAIHRYLRSKPAGVDALVWVGNYHNRGSGKTNETVYTRKLRTAFRSN